ncbi:DNA topoisomerase family protein [Motilimonas eburnea]|uniref:DNA topoisomerase family protein n=1 Tax=Motilimonas eburnea TaxID=1737488 RepID=UPI001E291611|nr:topoisomerase DNA-binding C4 zinc finger domain-containing protein [Motilimonas eburnea]
MSKIDHALFSAHEHALEKEACPQCGSDLQIKNSKHGPFLGCSAYPSCDYMRPLHHHGDITKILSGSECPECHRELAIKQGRYGMFIGCTGFPDCHHIESLSHKDNTNIPCPSCHKGSLVERQSRYGKLFYACDSYPKCKYAVNEKPVPQACPDCGWGILTEKKTAAGLRLVCPQKKCGYKSEPL